MSKPTLDLKVEIEPIYQSQTEGILKMKTPVTKTETTEARFIRKIKQMEERISDLKNMTEKWPHLSHQNIKCKCFLSQNIHGNLGHYEQIQLRIEDAEEVETTLLKGL